MARCAGISRRSGSARAGLRSALTDIAIQGRPADTEEFRDISSRVSVGLHPSRGGDVLCILDLARTTEFGAVGMGRDALELGTFLD